MAMWQEWLAEQRDASTMEVTETELERILGAQGKKPWGMVAGNLGRWDQRFWRVIGMSIIAKREVPAWEQPMVEVLDGLGTVALVCDPNSHRYLLQAKTEPGNKKKDGHVLLAPTLQASRANLEAAHGGKRPPRAELLDGRELRWTEFVQDGGIFHGKVNRYAVLLKTEQSIGDPQPNERWFTHAELREAVREGACNEHLLQALALEFV
ncbi:MAG: NDP-hexose 2,3-dehydratase family protein [Patescibacteria group bacterium]